MRSFSLLDCTLRDGAYITDSRFGTPAIKGIIKKMQDAGADIIECGWLKDKEHEEGSSFYHIPSDLEQYLIENRNDVLYAVMIDWDRYDVKNLPEYDGKSVDAIRVVFPLGKHREGILVGKEIRSKGYRVFFQAANTLAYSDTELIDLANCMNEFLPESLSVVDTFGAMFEEDVDRIVDILDRELKTEIKIGFHAHNNQQLAFSLSAHFIEIMESLGRSYVVDSTLCGMGRGAGNATTELVASYLNRKHNGGYDLDCVMDAIDVYMQEFMEKYNWGYSTPYFIAGMYQCHVNNIAYLLNNHRTNSKDMRNIIESLSQEDRRKYDYDLLEEKYIENQDRLVDDESGIRELKKIFEDKEILMLCPGRSLYDEKEIIEDFIKEHSPVVIGVNAIIPEYKYDYLFFVNHARYEYASQVHSLIFNNVEKILLSNIKTIKENKEIIVNYNRAVKRGWEHFDNAAICCLRLMDKLHLKSINVAGFDGFKHQYNESYADTSLPSLNPDNKWDELNDEIKDMFRDFKKSAKHISKISFITDSIFDI